MTGLENILTQIRAEGTQKSDEILAKAEQTAKEYIDEVRKTASAMTAEYTQKAKDMSDEVLRRMSASDALDEKRQILQKKQELIQSALKAAKSELCESDTKKYFDLLKALLAVYAQKTKGEILMSDGDKKRMTDDFKAALNEYSLTVADKSPDFAGGFILVYGSVEVNCTFDALFDAYNEELSDMLNTFLFGGGV